MANNIYDTINQLERDLRDHDAYHKLEAAMDAVLADEEALKLYQEFRDIQMSVQTKAQQGQEVSEDEIKRAQELQKIMGENETIKGLLQAEQELNQVVDEINKVVTQPIVDIYQKAAK